MFRQLFPNRKKAPVVKADINALFEEAKSMEVIRHEGLKTLVTTYRDPVISALFHDPENDRLFKWYVPPNRALSCY